MRLRTIHPIAGLAMLLLAGSTQAHEIPNDVVIHGFLRPDGNRMHILLRVPLNAMRDSEFPQTAAGYLDVERAGTVLSDAVQVWITDNLTVYENDRQLVHPKPTSIRVALPSDKSFASYAEARAHLAAPQQETGLVWSQALLDVALEVPIQSDQSRFSLHSALARLGVRTVTVLGFQPPGGKERIFEFEGDPGLMRLDPSWTQAVGRFVRSGFEHILEGIDHLLFLACLVLPLRSLRALIPVVTAFTAAHSVTLIASAYGIAPGALWFPPLVETLIAFSIVFMAIENIVAAANHSTGGMQRRWIIVFGFGLIHGFGFSFALRQTLQFAGEHLLTSLVSFNIGVELGQLAVLLVLVPLLGWLFLRVIAERPGIIVISAFIAHTGWHWMQERAAQLMLYRWEWPVADAAFLAVALRLAFVVLLAGALVWLGHTLWQKRGAR
jgi:HupE / UreJ protein